MQSACEIDSRRANMGADFQNLARLEPGGKMIEGASIAGIDASRDFADLVQARDPVLVLANAAAIEGSVMADRMPSSENAPSAAASNASRG